MALVFTWDDRKAARNLHKHRISFEEAVAIFGDPLLLTVPDRAHSVAEERFFSMGRTLHGRLIVVAHTENGDTIRIINARNATAKETRTCEQGEDLA